LAGTAANLANRPRHLRCALDAVFADAQLGPRVSPARVAVIGHSLGGYTALAAAGGRPSCFAHESPDGQPQPVPVARDPRIAALVLLAPATPWLMADGALAAVNVPILMRTAEHDPHTPAFHAEVVLRGVPDRAQVDHRVVPNAGHFSFQTPFPAAMTRPEFPPSQDPPGFDRAAFQHVLQAEVLAFLRAALAAAGLAR
jgi:predicted dienelactone hydrolase